jgi:hypothetical protein
LFWYPEIPRNNFFRLFLINRGGGQLRHYKSSNFFYVACKDEDEEFRLLNHFLRSLIVSGIYRVHENIEA